MGPGKNVREIGGCRLGGREAGVCKSHLWGRTGESACGGHKEHRPFGFGIRVLRQDPELVVVSLHSGLTCDSASILSDGSHQWLAFFICDVMPVTSDKYIGDQRVPVSAQQLPE